MTPPGRCARIALPFFPGASIRSHPRLWDHDYLHLRPLARDLRRELGSLAERGSRLKVLDLGSGASPYRSFLERAPELYVRADVEVASRPDVVVLAEAVFHVVLCTQVLGLVRDPVRLGEEVGRVTRPGGRVFLTSPAAWPYDSGTTEHRLGRPQLERLFPGLAVRAVEGEGGMLALPFALFNLTFREAVRAAERRLGTPARLLRLPATLAYVLANSAGRLLETLADRGPLAPFLGSLDRRLPMNFLIVAEKPHP